MLINMARVIGPFAAFARDASSIPDNPRSPPDIQSTRDAGGGGSLSR